MVDAFAHLGVTHLEMPDTAFKIWKELKAHGLTH
jgi:carbon-monoxide dehydrogenase large subunit